MRTHIHDIKFIRMSGTQNNRVIYPQNQTHSDKKCQKSQRSLFAEHDRTHLNTGAATFTCKYLYTCRKPA